MHCPPWRVVHARALEETATMPYIRCDAEGTVIAMSLAPLEGFEPVEVDDPRLREFERRSITAHNKLRESDLEVVRVLDDLINLLVDKNTIRFTDLPEAAQQKLMQRRGLRASGAQLSLIDEDNFLV
jgi:hypothetical protein